MKCWFAVGKKRLTSCLKTPEKIFRALQSKIFRAECLNVRVIPSVRIRTVCSESHVILCGLTVFIILSLSSPPLLTLSLSLSISLSPSLSLSHNSNSNSEYRDINRLLQLTRRHLEMLRVMTPNAT